MKKDYKQLEILYESIITPTNKLLDEEEQLINRLAERIVKSLYTTLAPPNQFYGSEFLNVLVNFKLNKLFLSKVFSNATEKQLESIYYVFNEIILHILYRYLVRIIGIKTPEAVRFQTLEDWMNSVIRETAIPFDNKQQVLETFKNTIKDAILYLYKSEDPIQKNNEGHHQWYEWRREKLKFQDIHKKLPELKGIF
jgi:hypothetical protein